MSKCRWTPSPEKWDFTGNGLSIEYCGKPGKVTLGSLINDVNGWKILISEGECIKMAQRPCYAPQFYFKPNMKVVDYIEAILQEGVAHHVCLVYGDYRGQLELLADYLNIRKVVI
jgi:L-fucose isomerase-like protein